MLLRLLSTFLIVFGYFLSAAEDINNFSFNFLLIYLSVSKGMFFSSTPYVYGCIFQQFLSSKLLNYFFWRQGHKVRNSKSVSKNVDTSLYFGLDG